MSGKLETEDGVRGAVDVGGVRIVHESWGSGPALVCCHAFGVDRSMWALQRARFAEGHRLITFDQRGSGDSDHPLPCTGREDPYTIDTFADDLRGVLDDLEIETARILGFSTGAATALAKATPHGFSGCYRVTIDRPSMAEDLHRIQAPTLILVGERDVHYLEDAELMARRIPRATKVIVRGVGHPMSVEAPEVFADEVLRFLS